MMRPFQMPHQGNDGLSLRKTEASVLTESHLIQKFAAWLDEEDRKAELLPLWPQNLICTLGLVLLVSLAAFG